MSMTRFLLAVSFLWTSPLLASSLIFLSSGKTLSGVGTTQTTVAADLTLVTHGDSITRDLDAANYSYGLGALIQSGQGLHAQVLQRGVNGISFNYAWGGDPYTGTLITDGALVVDGLQSAVRPNWLIIFAGTNGMALGGHSAATEYTNFKTYIAARIVAGWVANRIVVCTMLPRTGFLDSTRQAFNASLVGDDGGYGYRLARLDQNSNIGDAGDDTNLTYFYDGLHPTTAGHAIISQVIYSAMFP